MAYNYVTVSGTFPILTGTVTFTPPNDVTDLTGAIPVLGPGPAVCTVSGGSFTSPALLATDNVGLLPAGWTWLATVALTGQNAYTYPVLIPAANGTAATLSALAVSASGGGSAEGFNNPMTSLGDMIAGGASGVAGRVAGHTLATKNFLTQTGTGSASAAPAWGTIASADVPTLNQNTTGTASNITDTLDQVPAPAANVSFSSHKITSLAGGSASTDAPNFGQAVAATSAPSTTAALVNAAAAAFASTAGSAYTLTLGDATVCGAGVTQFITKTTGDANTLSIAPAGGQTIAGTTLSVALFSKGDRLQVMSDGSNWQIIQYQVSDLIITSTQTFTVPNGWNLIDASVIAGGAGGAAGGTSSGNINQVGGSGGPAAVEVRELIAVTPGLALTLTVGGAGTGGTAPTAGGHQGTTGGNGTASSISGSGVVTVTSPAPFGSFGGLASSTTTTVTGAWGAGNAPGVTGTTGTASAGGAPGASTSTGAFNGGAPVGYASGGGGGGGPAASGSSLGGSAGSPGTPSAGGTAGASGASGTANGGTAASAAATSYGAGGGGGGGGAAGTGVSGAGGNGGPGVIILRRRG